MGWVELSLVMWLGCYALGDYVLGSVQLCGVIRLGWVGLGFVGLIWHWLNCVVLFCVEMSSL